MWSRACRTSFIFKRARNVIFSWRFVVVGPWQPKTSCKRVCATMIISQSSTSSFDGFLPCVSQTPGAHRCRCTILAATSGEGLWKKQLSSYIIVLASAAYQLMSLRVGATPKSGHILKLAKLLKMKSCVNNKVFTVFTFKNFYKQRFHLYILKAQISYKSGENRYILVWNLFSTCYTQAVW